LRIKGKLVRKSLKTKAVSVAKMRMVDLDRHDRKVAELHQPSAKRIFFMASFWPLMILRKRTASPHFPNQGESV
jgi:hypothetical protein